MVLHSIRFQGKTYPHYQIVNKNFTIHKDGKVIDFLYRLDNKPFCSVDTEDLIFTNYTEVIEEHTLHTLNANRFSVVDDTLVIAL